MEDIKELQTFFSSITLPETIQLSAHEKITDVKQMVKSHLNYIAQNAENKTFEPYLQRLRILKNKLQEIGTQKPR